MAKNNPLSGNNAAPAEDNLLSTPEVESNAAVAVADSPADAPKQKKEKAALKKLIAVFAPQRSVDGFATAPDGKIYNAPRELGIGRFALLALQCLLIMTAFSVSVPAAMGVSVPASLLVCGISTIIMVLSTRGRMFIFTASSPMFIAVYISIISDELDYSMGDIGFGLLISGLCFVAIGMLIWAFGIQRLKRLFDPLVAAPVTFLIGALTAIELARGTDEMWLTLLTAAVGLVVFALGSRKIRMFAPIAALVFGLIAAAISGSFAPTAHAEPIKFVAPHFELAVVGTLLVNSLAMMFPIFSLLSAGKLQQAERGRKPATETGYIIGSGLSIGLSGLFGAAPQTPSPHSVGLSSSTGVFDPLVAAVSAGMLIIISILPGVSGALAAIPQSVGMGVGLVLCTSLMRFSATSIKSLDLGNRRSSLIFYVTLASGFFFEGSPIVIPIQGRPLTIAGLGAAVIIGTLLNLIIPKYTKE